MYERLTAKIQNASKTELIQYIRAGAEEPQEELLLTADALRRRYYGTSVFFRGLVEFSNYCKNDCYYCGLQRSNRQLHRYRLSPDEIIACCRDGYERGFHSFVLQGGEDSYYNSGRMVEVVSAIKSTLPGCALTLSLGELSPEMYRRLYQAGADRFLLRHETASEQHYQLLHPPEMSLATRKRSLYAIKESGLIVGAGFMVGSPGQTYEHLAEDLLFLKQLQPQMVGIGPFIPQTQTRFSEAPAGSLALTLTMLALVRLILPRATLPSTTALETLEPGGREVGLKAGTNVVMPNLTPPHYRKDYMIYDGKTGVDDGVGEGLERIRQNVIAAGYTPDFSRGDPVTG